MALTFDLEFDHGRRSTYSECLCVTSLTYDREIDHEARKHYCLKLHIVDEGFVLVQRCSESIGAVLRRKILVNLKCCDVNKYARDLQNESLKGLKIFEVSSTDIFLMMLLMHLSMYCPTTPPRA